jgi:hypothetical protein
MKKSVQRPRQRFTVPETWRPILKRNEIQAGRPFDVLECGHSVPASDTPFRRFRSCPDCRIRVQEYADRARREPRAA